MRVRPLPLVAAVLGAAVLAACGDESVSNQFSGTQHKVVQTVVNLANDASANDASKICNNDLSSGLEAELAKSVPGQSCTTAVNNALNEVENYTLSPQTATINGSTATVTVTDTCNGRNHSDSLQLVLEGNSWKVNSLLTECNVR
ncbi:MAG TPA: hypothetical protein VHX88_08080 [Solirubrobacteraceae bacterium]|jgi:hypothetical protein|nr:hypothetical protein [Solirubrobacteraceae bacterium]